MGLVTRKYQKEIFGMTDEDFGIITTSYSISDRMIKESLALIKEWYIKQPHLPQIEFEDHYFERILAINKFSVEKTKRKMDNYFTVRTIIPEFFDNRDPWNKQIAKSMESFDWIFIPQLTPENHRISIMKIRGEDPDSYDPLIAMSVAFMIADIRLSLDICVGDVYIWDLGHLRLSHAVKMTPVMIKKAMYVIQNCYGARLKGIHMLNLPKYGEPVINVMKSIIKKKIADRIYFHQSLEDLHKMIPKEVLPSDYGGDVPRTSIQMADDVRNAMKSPEWRDFYIQSMSIKTDEKRRQGPIETWVDDLKGMEGSFRKLDID